VKKEEGGNRAGVFPERKNNQRLGGTRQPVKIADFCRTSRLSERKDSTKTQKHVQEVSVKKDSDEKSEPSASSSALRENKKRGRKRDAGAKNARLALLIPRRKPHPAPVANYFSGENRRKRKESRYISRANAKVTDQGGDKNSRRD